MLTSSSVTANDHLEKAFCEFPNSRRIGLFVRRAVSGVTPSSGLRSTIWVSRGRITRIGIAAAAVAAAI